MSDSAASELARQNYEHASYSDWRDLAIQAIRGGDFSKKLRTATHEGYSLEPIYCEETHPNSSMSAAAQVAASRRPARVARLSTDSNWDRFLEHLKLDAQGELESLLVNCDNLNIKSQKDWQDIFEAIGQYNIELALCPSTNFLSQSLMLLHSAEELRPNASLSLGVDPISSLAKCGSLQASYQDNLEAIGILANQCQAKPAKTSLLRLSTSVIHEAGGNAAQELGYLLALICTYLRDLPAHCELSLAQICELMELDVSIESDQFLSMCKIRAAKYLCATLLQECEVETKSDLPIQAHFGQRDLSEYDPWVNLLRMTSGSFAAICAGVDRLALPSFDSRGEEFSELGCRLARNTQHILKRESKLDFVLDPASGSHYVEERTQQLALQAWEFFQWIEECGGLLECLSSTKLHRSLKGRWHERLSQIESRKEALTGVSEFPILDQELDQESTNFGDQASQAKLKRESAPSKSQEQLKLLGKEYTWKNAKAAMLAQASSDELQKSWRDSKSKSEDEITQALPVHTRAECFEELRKASDLFLEKQKRRPQAFLANMGSMIQYSARSTYATNFLAAGGIEAIGAAGYPDIDSAIQAFKKNGSAVVVICSSDDLYQEKAQEWLEAFCKAGASHLVIAGKIDPEKRPILKKAGLNDSIHLGSNSFQSLELLHNVLGLTAYTEEKG